MGEKIKYDVKKIFSFIFVVRMRLNLVLYYDNFVGWSGKVMFFNRKMVF